jgi:hypothetical protein
MLVPSPVLQLQNEGAAAAQSSSTGPLLEAAHELLRGFTNWSARRTGGATAAAARQLARGALWPTIGASGKDAGKAGATSGKAEPTSSSHPQVG